ncbi:MAG: DUF2946 family protein [Cytophagales bacterium]|nr:DUF2946 family protein [Cytophagales bacterium]
MDDIVKQAMAKWPNVPHCYGWLGLDTRGDWYMRDDRVQALGSFRDACLRGDKKAKGSRLEHEKLIAFIGRNYASERDAQGVEHWFFQNGPQRVYVDLADTPYIWRLHLIKENQQCRVEVRSHTGAVTEFQSIQISDDGRVYLTTALGFGLVHTQDVHMVAEALELGLWQIT